MKNPNPIAPFLHKQFQSMMYSLQVQLFEDLPWVHRRSQRLPTGVSQ